METNATNLAETTQLTTEIAVSYHPVVTDTICHNFFIDLINVFLKLNGHRISREFHSARNGIANHDCHTERVAVTADVNSRNRTGFH